MTASVVVLALSTAAHLLSLSPLDDENQQKLTLLYDRVQTDSQMQDSSVGAAFFTSLTSVAQDQSVTKFCISKKGRYPLINVIL
jgi:hypothetical protein